jgi:N-acetylmuramoyl-L-alanine amidase
VLAALSIGLLSACGGSPKGTSSGAAGQPAGEVSAPVAQSAAPTPTATPDPSGLNGKTIVLDPGHNGANGDDPTRLNRKVFIGNAAKECDTTGTASAAGYSEHAFNWDVATRMKKILEAAGSKVVLTRPNDTSFGPCINERADIGNRAHADAAISVHADSAPASDHGFHVIEPSVVKGYNDQMVTPSKKLGQSIHDAYLKGTGIVNSTYAGTNGIDVRDDLGGLNLSKIPKVFIECGNMDNSGDIAKLSDSGFRQRIAQALVDGFSAYFAKS